MSAELLPCPFCGSTNLSKPRSGKRYVDCVECGAFGPGPAETLKSSLTQWTIVECEIFDMWNKRAALRHPPAEQALIDWAAERWHAEVANRPMVNVHRRSLDGTWRQVLRHLGADDRARLGPTHDELRAEIGSKEWAAMNGTNLDGEPLVPSPAPAGALKQPRLKVWLTKFPESNGKTNWTALLVREEQWDGLVGNCGGITIARGEFWNRVAYDAQRAMFLLGQRDTEPFILDYGDDIKTPEEWKGETHRAILATRGEGK